MMIPDLHNSIYFWGAVGLVYVYFQFQPPQEVLVVIDPTHEQIHLGIHQDIHQARHEEVKIRCWNEITQQPEVCHEH